MKNLTAILAVCLALYLVVPAAQANGPTPPRYVSGALYTAPHGRGTYRGWVFGALVVRSETGGWHLTARGWVQGIVSARWSGAWHDRVQAGLSYWASYHALPAAWW